MEAPAMFKRDGKYYLIMSGCTGWAPNAGRSAVAPSIWGPWEELENPFVGEGSDLSFHSQSTYVLPAPGKSGQFIYMVTAGRPRMQSTGVTSGFRSVLKEISRSSNGRINGVIDVVVLLYLKFNNMFL